MEFLTDTIDSFPGSSKASLHCLIKANPFNQGESHTWSVIQLWAPGACLEQKHPVPFLGREVRSVSPRLAQSGVCLRILSLGLGWVRASGSGPRRRCPSVSTLERPPSACALPTRHSLCPQSLCRLACGYRLSRNCACFSLLLVHECLKGTD